MQYILLGLMFACIFILSLMVDNLSKQLDDLRDFVIDSIKADLKIHKLTNEQLSNIIEVINND